MTTKSRLTGIRGFFALNVLFHFSCLLVSQFVACYKLVFNNSLFTILIHSLQKIQTWGKYVSNHQIRFKIWFFHFFLLKNPPFSLQIRYTPPPHHHHLFLLFAIIIISSPLIHCTDIISTVNRNHGHNPWSFLL